MPERDFPIGHPAASDYAGQSYRPPFNPSAEDYPTSHPARGGKNSALLDSPDGQRAAQNARAADLHELAAVGSLPALKDPHTGEPMELTPEQVAFIYTVRTALRDPAAEWVTKQYQLEPLADTCVCGLPKAAHTDYVKGHAFTARTREAPVLADTPKEQAKSYLLGLNYTPERAEEILTKYGVPEVMQDRSADTHR